MGVNLSKFLHTENGKIIMSILLGFGLASLFRSVCKGTGCTKFFAAPLEEVKDKIYKRGKRCISYNPLYAKCSYKNAKIVSFE